MPACSCLASLVHRRPHRSALPASVCAWAVAGPADGRSCCVASPGAAAGAGTTHSLTPRPVSCGASSPHKTPIRLIRVSCDFGLPRNSIINTLTRILWRENRGLRPFPEGLPTIRRLRPNHNCPGSPDSAFCAAVSAHKMRDRPLERSLCKRPHSRACHGTHIPLSGVLCRPAERPWRHGAFGMAGQYGRATCRFARDLPRTGASWCPHATS